MCFSFSTFFSVSRHIHGPTVCVSHFPGFLTFHAIFQVLQCTFIFFHVFHCFSPYSRSYHVRFSFSYFLSFFSPYYRSYSLGVSFFTFPSFSSHIPGPTMFVSHFPRLSVFSTYSRHNSPCVSFHKFFRFLALFQVLLCTFLIFHSFDSFSKYFRSYIVSHFPRFSVFLDIFQFLPCEFLIFVCQYSRHMSCPTVYIYHFSHFSVFLAIFQFLSCEILIFLICQFSRNIPGPTVCVSHFPRFSAYLAIFTVLQCVCLIFQVFSLFMPYSRSFSVHLSFFTFFIVSRHIPGPTM